MKLDEQRMFIDAPPARIYELLTDASQLVEWMAVSVGPDGTLVSDLFATLRRAGVTDQMVNPGIQLAIDDLARHVPIAVEAARAPSPSPWPAPGRRSLFRG